MSLDEVVSPILSLYAFATLVLHHCVLYAIHQLYYLPYTVVTPYSTRPVQLYRLIIANSIMS